MPILISIILTRQVKRSREKYKAKKRTNDTTSQKECELQDEVDSLKSKLSIFAKALRHPSLLTSEEKSVIQDSLPTVVASEDVNADDQPAAKREKVAGDSTGNGAAHPPQAS